MAINKPIYGLIYRFRNKLNGKAYVGQTISSPVERVRRHFKKKGTLIGRALRKYGLKRFEFSIIDIALNRDRLNQLERSWIQTLDSRHPRGYNLTEGGEGCTGYRHTRQTKEHLRMLSSGHVHSLTTRLKMGQAQRGIRKSVEHKRKLSESNIGKHDYLKTVNIGRLRPDLKAKNKDPEFRRLISEGVRRSHVRRKMIYG